MEVYIDEAGRGPLAGPIYLGFVFINNKIPDFGFQDSKTLTYKKREDLYQNIKNLTKENKIFYTYISYSNYSIDNYGISFIMKKGIINGIKKLKKNNNLNSSEVKEIYLDGNTDFKAGEELNIKINCIKNGDKKLYQISMASIIAKVLRDKYMEKIGKNYPEYGFNTNKGYGTQKHIDAIKKYGPCPYHRKYFLRKIISQ